MSYSEHFDRALENDSTMHYYAPDHRGDDSVVTWLVRALADVEGRSPDELAVNISDYVDPDALERLFGSAGTAHAQLLLHINGHEVQIGADGSLLVIEAPSPNRT